MSLTSKAELSKMSKVTYTSAIGSLIYVMVCKRSYIAYVVGVISHFLTNSDKEHWETVKWILRYLRGTSKLLLCFGGAKPILEASPVWIWREIWKP